MTITAGYRTTQAAGFHRTHKELHVRGAMGADTGGKARVKRHRGLGRGPGTACRGGGCHSSLSADTWAGSQSNTSCPDWTLQSCPPVSGPVPTLSGPLGSRTLNPHSLSWHKAQHWPGLSHSCLSAQYSGTRSWGCVCVYKLSMRRPDCSRRLSYCVEASS